MPTPSKATPSKATPSKSAKEQLVVECSSPFYKYLQDIEGLTHSQRIEMYLKHAASAKRLLEEERKKFSLLVTDNNNDVDSRNALDILRHTLEGHIHAEYREEKKNNEQLQPLKGGALGELLSDNNKTVFQQLPSKKRKAMETLKDVNQPMKVECTRYSKGFHYRIKPLPK